MGVSVSLGKVNFEENDMMLFADYVNTTNVRLQVVCRGLPDEKKTTTPKETSWVKGLCSSVEMLLVDQTMSYINYELLIDWFWQ
jgi:hypothetical protein